MCAKVRRFFELCKFFSNFIIFFNKNGSEKARNIYFRGIPNIV